MKVSAKNIKKNLRHYHLFLLRYYTEELREHMREPDSSIASKEVRGLPDVLSKLYSFEL